MGFTKDGARGDPVNRSSTGPNSAGSRRLVRALLTKPFGGSLDERPHENDIIPDGATTQCVHCGKSLHAEFRGLKQTDLACEIKDCPDHVKIGHIIPANIPVVGRSAGEKQVTIHDGMNQRNIYPTCQACNNEEEIWKQQLWTGTPKMQGLAEDELRNWAKNPEMVHPAAGTKNWPPYTAATPPPKGWKPTKDKGEDITLGDMMNKRVDWLIKRRSEQESMRDSGMNSDDIEDAVTKRRFYDETRPDGGNVIRPPGTHPDEARWRSNAAALGVDPDEYVQQQLTKQTSVGDIMERIAKDYDEATRKEYAEKGWALKDGSYPISDCGDVKDAVHRVGTGSHAESTIRAHILKRWKALKCGGKEPFTSDNEKEASVDVERDYISESGPTPMQFIEDHRGKLAIGINPATCERCGAPMELHNKWETNKQASAEPDIETSEDYYEFLAKHLVEEHGAIGFGKYASSEDDLLIDSMRDVHVTLHKQAQFVNSELLHLGDPQLVWSDYQTHLAEGGPADINEYAAERHKEIHEYNEQLEDKERVDPEPEAGGHGSTITDSHMEIHAAVQDENGQPLTPPDPNKPGFQVEMPGYSGSEALQAIQADKCPTCKNPVGDFRDEISKREYGISGMCQTCQDSVFGGAEDDETEDPNSPFAGVTLEDIVAELQRRGQNN
jgi:hypothetical protein